MAEQTTESGVDARRLYPVTILRTYRENGVTRYGFTHLSAELVAQRTVINPTPPIQESATAAVPLK